MRVRRSLLLAPLGLALLASAAHGQTQLFEVRATRPGDWLGSALAVGDVDRDGRPDFVVGASASPFSTVRSHVDAYSGLDGRLLWRLESSGPTRFGSSVGVADVDADGYADLLVGDPGFRNRTGAVFIYSGRNGRLLRRLDGPGGVNYAWSLSGAGDVDRDGHDDVIVGAHSNSVAVASHAFVHSGKDGRLLYDLQGKGGGWWDFGRFVAGGSDVDGDGVPDLLVAAPGSAFRVYLYSGASGKLLRTHAGRPGSRFGWSATFAGDVDRDGRADILVGTSFRNRAFVYSGKDGRLLWTLSGNSARFGEGVGGAGNVDGDGHADLAVSDSGAGTATVFSGKTGKPLFTVSYRRSRQNVVPVAGMGDVDGDGRSEIVVGFPGNAAGNGTGRVRVHTGRFLASFRFGRGCAAGTPPVLDATVQGRGRPLTLSIRNARANQAGFQLVGLPATPLSLGSGCFVYLDPSLHAVVTSLRTGAAGTWSHTLQVPAHVARDSQVTFQAVLASSAPPLGLDFTNGVLATFR